MSKKKFLIISICFVLLTSVVQAQNNNEHFNNALRSLMYYSERLDENFINLNPLEASISELELSIAQEFNIDQSKILLGFLYQYIDKPELALQQYEKFSEANPDEDWVYVLKGDVHQILGNDTQARVAYQKALEEEEYGKAYFGLAQLETKEKNIEEPISLLQKSIELVPDYLKAHLALGVLYYERDEFDLAKESFQTVTRLNSNVGKAYRYLGEIYEQEGNDEQAEYAYYRAEQLEQ